MGGGRGRKWCADEGHRVLCNRPWIRGWEKFYIWSSGGRVALRGGRHKRWCADEGNRVRCNRPWIRGWEKFYAHKLTNNIHERRGKAAHRERVGKHSRRVAHERRVKH